MIKVGNVINCEEDWKRLLYDPTGRHPCVGEERDSCYVINSAPISANFEFINSQLVHINGVNKQQIETNKNLAKQLSDTNDRLVKMNGLCLNLQEEINKSNTARDELSKQLETFRSESKTQNDNLIKTTSEFNDNMRETTEKLKEIKIKLAKILDFIPKFVRTTSEYFVYLVRGAEPSLDPYCGMLEYL